MSNRKKKLIIIQSLLFLIATVIFYFVYYYQNINENISENTETSKIFSKEDQSKSNFFENVQYQGIDANGNRYLLQSELASFDEENPELINMVNMMATFYFKNGQEIKFMAIKANIITKLMIWNSEIMLELLEEKNKIFANNLDYYNLKKLINIYGNVKGESLDGNFTADILELNIENQSIDFSMKNSEQVRINLNK